MRVKRIVIQNRYLADNRPLLVFAVLGIVLAATTLVYWPGLSGGFLLDDFPNLVDNPALRSGAPSMASLWKAAFSMDAGPTGRPLSMLSFALEASVFGLNPWVMKLTNLGIHLLNGLLVFLLLRRILRLVMANGAIKEPAMMRSDSIAVAVTAAWLLSPINLTGVLYVIQRMESLATLFMLAGLIAYTCGRERMRSNKPGGLILIWGGLAGGTLLGILAKESAALLPVYALALEAVLFQLRTRHGRIDRQVLALFTVVLIVPGCLGLAWLLPGVLSGSAYASRPFDLSQRLWTEGRALWSYLDWILVPNLQSLSLYHDAYPVSSGWLHPFSTLPAALGLVGLLVLGLSQIRRRPLIALGLLWFLGGHLLVSTILPLELVYEHRNYLPSLGILLAVFSLILLEPLKPPMKAARIGFALSLVLLYGFLTLLRADTWGDPLLLAWTESARHPNSPRADYALGQTLTVLAPDPSAPLFSLGMKSFDDAAHLSSAGLLPDQALIFLSAKDGLAVKAQWWNRMRQIIATHPLAAQDINALYKLIDCRSRHLCRFDDRQLRRTIALAAQRNPHSPVILTLYANYATNIAHDYRLAQTLMQRTVALAPANAQFWENLVTLQIALGEKEVAEAGIERLGELNRLGSLDTNLDKLKAAYAVKFGRGMQQSLSPP